MTNSPEDMRKPEFRDLNDLNFIPPDNSQIVHKKEDPGLDQDPAPQFGGDKVLMTPQDEAQLEAIRAHREKVVEGSSAVRRLVAKTLKWKWPY